MELYKIDNQLKVLLDSANPETGEIDMAAYDSIVANRTQKQEGVVLYSLGLSQHIDAIDTELLRLKKMKETAERKSTWLKNYLKTSMELVGEKGITFGVHSATIRNNPASLVILTPDLIPPKYITIITESRIDKASIKDDLKKGVVVDGVELVVGTHLRIN